jgi:ribulose-5-phosphate 4-epimerase/fuculose-1-phosphate aldolase
MDAPVMAAPVMATSVMTHAEEKARIELAACYRLIARLGLDDLIYNHISMRVPGTTDQFFINPYGMLFEEITASSLVRIDLQGRKLDNTPYEVNSAAFVIHGAIHTGRHDAVCVLHTHSDASVAVSAQRQGLLPFSQFAMRFYGRQSFHDYEGVAIDVEEQARLISHMGENRVMVMRNHGILTIGRSPGEAFMLLYYFERAARIQLMMQASGVPIVVPPHEVCEKAARQFNDLKGDILVPGEREWPALLRQLDRADGSFRL